MNWEVGIRKAEKKLPKLFKKKGWWERLLAAIYDRG